MFVLNAACLRTPVNEEDLMSTDTDFVMQLPFDRPNVIDIAPIHDELRRKEPITRVRTPAGDPAWLVMRYEEIPASVTRDLRNARCACPGS